jgi:hypothetical protein
MWARRPQLRSSIGPLKTVGSVDHWLSLGRWKKDWEEGVVVGWEAWMEGAVILHA